MSSATVGALAAGVFTIATYNALFQGHYERYARVPTMDVRERERLTCDLLRRALERSPVVCLQECWHKASDLEAAIPGTILLRADTKLRESSAILYDSKRMRLTRPPWLYQFNDPQRGPGAKSMKHAISLTLTDIQNPEIVMDVTSVHLPFTRGAQERLALLEEVLAHAVPPPSETKAHVSIVAGDFNLDPRHAGLELQQVFGGQGWADLSGHVPVSTAGATGSYTKLDYVYGKLTEQHAASLWELLPAGPSSVGPGGALCGGAAKEEEEEEGHASLSVGYEPTDHKDLVKHVPFAGESEPFGAVHPSDHSLVYGSFQLRPRGTPVKEECDGNSDNSAADCPPDVAL